MVGYAGLTFKLLAAYIACCQTHFGNAELLNIFSGNYSQRLGKVVDCAGLASYGPHGLSWPPFGNKLFKTVLPPKGYKHMQARVAKGHSLYENNILYCKDILFEQYTGLCTPFFS